MARITYREVVHDGSFGFITPKNGEKDCLYTPRSRTGFKSPPR